jgi:hypothetical protein
LIARELEPLVATPAARLDRVRRWVTGCEAIPPRPLHAEFIDGDHKGIQKKMRDLYASEPPTFFYREHAHLQRRHGRLDRPRKYFKHIAW